jgi:tRNA(adenine34) deaminase
MATAWVALEPAWRECLDLAWEAYASETIPVGAVVVGPHGAVVARGRNRVYDRGSEPGQLSWSLLAHAEVNALAQLAPEPRYEDHTLLTALEPCSSASARPGWPRSAQFASAAPIPTEGRPGFAFRARTRCSTAAGST